MISINVKRKASRKKDVPFKKSIAGIVSAAQNCFYEQQCEVFYWKRKRQLVEGGIGR